MSKTITTTTTTKKPIPQKPTKPTGKLASDLQKAAVELVQLNIKKNAAENEHKKKRAAFLLTLKEKHVSDYDFVTTINGVKGTIDVMVERSNVSTIDIDGLLKKISMQQFLKIAKVTKGDVEKLLGKEVAESLTIVSEGTENVTVKFTSAEKAIH